MIEKNQLKKDLYEYKIDNQEGVTKNRNLSSNIKICCRGLKQLVGEKVIVFFKGGILWCGIPSETFALNYDCWVGNGCNCMIIKVCPFCQTKLKRKVKKEVEEK